MTAGGRQRRLLGVGASLLVIAALFVGLVFGIRELSGLGSVPAALPSTIGPHVTLSAFPTSYPCHGGGPGEPGGGANPDWVTFCPTTSIQVPAYSTVTITIKQYDTSTTLHNPFFARVTGTVGDVAYVNGRPMRSVNPSGPGHTFTIQTMDTNEHPIFVSVPLPGVSTSAPDNVTIAGHHYPTPNIIVFRFKTGAPGQYIWHCYDPCGTGLTGTGIGGQEGFGGPMATIGYMSGTLTVT